MIFVMTAVYFSLWSIVIWLGFYLYAKTLLRLGNSGWKKHIFGFLAYALLACLLVSPLLIAFSFIESWRAEFSSNYLYMVYFLICFLVTPLLGGFYFRSNYLGALKSLGYFSKS